MASGSSIASLLPLPLWMGAALPPSISDTSARFRVFKPNDRISRRGRVVFSFSRRAISQHKECVMPNCRSWLSRACSLVILVLAAWAEAQTPAPTAWWNTDWKCRRRVTVLGRTETTSDDVCFVEFPTAGMTKPGGEDVRVLEGASPVHSKVLFMGPGDLCKLAIKMSSAKGPSTFYIYYGNPKASAQPAVWEPKRGCLLETRRYVGGGCGTWEQMQDTIRKSKGQTYGVGYVKNIFMGYNPFGPSENYISLFTGYFDCKQPGTYSFCTTSDEASFMFLDGKLLVEWPGHHGAPPLALPQFTKKIQLTKGVHKIEYYHLQTTDRAVAVAAWQPPGHPKILPIPEDAFTPVSRGTVTGYEIQGVPIAADFSWDNRGEAIMGERLFYRVGFTDKTTGQSGTRATPRWNFGDGLEGEGKVIEHIYFQPGMYTVTLSV
ncbi:MAG: PKD domain-containing protein, partial [Planctomycetes bacterium]|nr:PKD domain-containing protein [Planctomycetota bacterium]